MSGTITPLTKEQRELVENNMPLVDFTIRTYYSAAIQASSSWYVDYEDLRQSGMIGLCKAAANYNDVSDRIFSSYAVWQIRKAVMKAILHASKSAQHETDAYIEWSDDSETNIIDASKSFDSGYLDVDTELLLQQLYAKDRNRELPWCKRNFEMFRLRLHGYEYETIARLFNTTPGNVRMYCVRARRALRKAYERSEWDAVV